MQKKVTIMNFSHVYEEENFYQEYPNQWVDCYDISGTNCYMDNRALKQIAKRINGISQEGLHFIDSGNYHYVSGIWMNKISRPFDLVLLDNHPDMQKPQFDHVISCGGWVRQLKEQDPLLKDIVMIDVDPALYSQVCCPGKVHYFTHESIKNGVKWSEEKRPVYISLDKDVLNRRAARTDWSQGTMTLKDLMEVLTILFRNYTVIGMDVCGEKKQSDKWENIQINNNTNKILIESWYAI